MKRQTKSKVTMKTTMSDFAANEFPSEERQKPKLYINTSGDTIPAGEKLLMEREEAKKTGWAERDAEIHEYNKNIFTPDPDFAAFIPNKFYIVRCFHKEYIRSASGIIISEPTMYVPEKTMNGMGNLQTVATPWAFHNVGVIIAAPEGSPRKPGEILQLGYSVVLPAQKQKLADWALPNAFMLYPYQEWIPPTSVKDKNFGYFMVDPYHDVLGVISRELFDRLNEKGNFDQNS